LHNRKKSGSVDSDRIAEEETLIISGLNPRPCGLEIDKSPPFLIGIPEGEEAVRKFLI
jgi:hypothetical protein